MIQTLIKEILQMFEQYNSIDFEKHVSHERNYDRGNHGWRQCACIVPASDFWGFMR